MKPYEAAEDMKIYFMQQVWLQNFPRVFEFFIDKFESVSEDLL